MKAISIRQPWAWLIMNGGKDIENRDWPTSVRGRVLVHASKGMTRYEYEDALMTTASVCGGIEEAPSLPAFEDLQRGGILGTVEIVDCVTASTSRWFFGRYGFVLRNPRPQPFIPYKGMLGFFEVDAS